MVASSAAAFPIPVTALEVEVKPENPRLGDTISVLVETESSSTVPTVSLKQRLFRAGSVKLKQN